MGERFRIITDNRKQNDVSVKNKLNRKMVGESVIKRKSLIKKELKNKLKYTENI